MQMKINALTKYLIDYAKIGYRKLKFVAMMLARQITLKRNTPFKYGLPSEKWWKGLIATEKFG